jgi:hypothetical protein
MTASTIAYSAIPWPLQDDQNDFRGRAGTFGKLFARICTVLAGMQREHCFYKGFNQASAIFTEAPVHSAVAGIRAALAKSHPKNKPSTLN